MSYPLVLAFLFYFGAILGWIIEFFYRNLISHSGPKGKYFINPGFCKGPWLPIYGIGLSLMFTISYIVTNKIGTRSALTNIVVVVVIMIVMVIIEFVGGMFLLKVLNMRLWDYRKEKGNFMGIICPKFTLIWGSLGAIYYFFIHEYILYELEWLSNNLAFSFFVGLFFGLFIVDLIASAKEATLIKQYGDDKGVIVKIEELKSLIAKRRKENGDDLHFFNQTRVAFESIKTTLDNAVETLEDKKNVLKRSK